MNVTGNTEGTPQLRDSVETTRATPIDWSNIRAEYAELHSLKALGQLHGVGWKAARAALVRAGVPISSRGTRKGQRKSQTWREASAVHWNDPVWRAEQRRKWLERLPSMNGPATNSPLERKLLGALERAGIGYKHQRLLLDKYLVDISIHQAPVLIEADGALHVRSKEKDAKRDAELTAAGFRVFRFTRRPINSDPDGCIRQVAEAAGLVREENPIFETYLVRGTNHPSWRGGPRTLICPTCGTEFSAYGKRRITCSRQCQVEWQRTNRASVQNRRSNGPAMKALWDDPEWRAAQTARIRNARWGGR